MTFEKKQVKKRSHLMMTLPFIILYYINLIYIEEDPSTTCASSVSED